MEYLPTFTINVSQHAGKYSMHGASATNIFTFTWWKGTYLDRSIQAFSVVLCGRLGWWFHPYLLCSSLTLGKWPNLTCAYFFKWVGSTTREMRCSTPDSWGMMGEESVKVWVTPLFLSVEGLAVDKSWSCDKAIWGNLLPTCIGLVVL